MAQYKEKFTPTEFFEYIKDFIEGEDYRGDFDKCTIEIQDSDGFHYKGEGASSWNILVRFESPVLMDMYLKEEKIQQLNREAKEKIRKQVYGE